MIDMKNPVLDFSAEDRCDRCGAQAYSLAQQVGFAELLFCLHHRKQNIDALLDNGWEVIDDYEAIANLADHVTV